jgi:hypothetical protein
MKEPMNKENRTPGRRSKAPTTVLRRETRKRWVQRGQYAVEVEVEVVYPEDDASEPCLQPATVRRLHEIARRAEQGDVAYLRRVGRVFQLLANRQAR